MTGTPFSSCSDLAEQQVPHRQGGFGTTNLVGLVHAAHAATARHTTAAAGASALLIVFLDVCHQSFGGEHQAGDGSGVLQCETSDLGRVNDASLDEIAELAVFRVEAEIVVLESRMRPTMRAPSWPAL